jgi:Mrp family chromosome partitioning ATPase
VVGAILQNHRALSIPQLLRLASENADFQQALHGLVHALGIGGHGRTQRIMVTSAEPGEGKTATLLTLAEHLAAAGRRVLIVECDARSPALEQVLGLSPGAGLCGLATGAIALEDAVLRTDHQNLDVLPLGRGEVPVSDLLAHGLVAQLSELGAYDAILIDTPLPNRRGDHLTGIDRVLLCVRSDRTSIEPAIAAIHQARARGAADVAIVVTMTEPEQSCTDKAASFATAGAYARAG